MFVHLDWGISLCGEHSWMWVSTFRHELFMLKPEVATGFNTRQTNRDILIAIYCADKLQAYDSLCFKSLDPIFELFF
jgi:hypothetical protein